MDEERQEKGKDGLIKGRTCKTERERKRITNNETEMEITKRKKIINEREI